MSVAKRSFLKAKFQKSKDLKLESFYITWNGIFGGQKATETRTTCLAWCRYLACEFRLGVEGPVSRGWQQASQSSADAILPSHVLLSILRHSQTSLNIRSPQWVLGLSWGLLPVGHLQSTSAGRRPGGIQGSCTCYLKNLYVLHAKL